MKEHYRYTKRDLDREFKRGASRGRDIQKHEDIEKFLEDINNYFSGHHNKKIVELKWEAKLKE